MITAHIESCEENLEYLKPQTVRLVHVVLTHRHIRALDGIARCGVLRQEAVIGNRFLALNPSSHAHGVALQELRGNESSTAALIQPRPCGFIYLACNEHLAVLLSC